MSNLLADQIEIAKKDIRQQKKTCPYLFPEYNRMIQSKMTLKEARRNYKQAKREWEKLGK